ncbi:MAG: hypothetical protein RR501_10120 [Cloacibacillus sp.]
MQEDADAATVLEASNEWNDYVNKYWNDPDKGMKATRQLGNAKGMYEDTGKYLEEVTNRCAEKLRTPEQKQAFLRSVAGSRMSNEERASVWEAQQMDKHSENVTKDTVNNAIASVVEDPSQTNFNAQFERARDAMLFRLRGADEATRQTAIDGLRSDFQTGIVGGYLQKDPIVAEKYYEAVKNEIMPAARIKLEEAVKDAARPIKAEAIYKQTDGDFNAGAAVIRDTYPPAEQRGMRKVFEAVWSDREQEKRFSDSEKEGKIIGLIRNGGKLSDINAAIKNAKFNDEGIAWKLEDMRDRRLKLGDWAPKSTGGDGGKSDPAVVRYLTDLKMGGKLFGAAPTWEDFRQKFGAGLSASKYEEYSHIYLAKDGKKLPAGAVKVNINATSIVERKAKESGIKGDEIGILKDEVNDRLAQFRSDNQREPNNKEVQGMVSDMLIDVKVGEDDFVWKSDVKQKAYQIKLEPDQKIINGQLMQKDPDSDSGWSRVLTYEAEKLKKNKNGKRR